MAQIRLQNVAFGYKKSLFEDVNVMISDHDRVGIVGNNGEGKSTLLKCIAGVIADFKGEITKPKNWRFGLIEQDVPKAVENLSLYDVIADSIPVEERDYNLWKVDVALDTFQAPEDIRGKPIRELSGGWQRLALIARTALADPDVLLLDEPTNHLDVEKMAALEEWLNGQLRDKPMIAVSHDRNFLEACTNRTLFLRGGQVHDYKHSYFRARQLLREDDKAAAAQRERELDELSRLQKSASELRQVGVNFFSDAALTRAKQMERRIESLRAQVTPVYDETRREIKLNSSDTHAKYLINLENVTIKAPDGKLLFQIPKLAIARGERIVVLGENGAGKSQFIQHLLRAFADPERARNDGIQITPTAKLGYVDQHLSTLPLAETVRDYVAEISGKQHQNVAALLVTVGFAYESQDLKIGSLSQGQRARLNLLALRLIEPNFYIMDEPTNHLDIAGQEALEREIIDHAAASILISHDRAFVKNIGTKFYQIHKGKLLPKS